MKRLLYILLTLSLLLSLVACENPEVPAETEIGGAPLQSAEPPPAIDELRINPPKLELRYQGGSAELTAGNGEWSYHTGGGSWTSTVMCGSHPLDTGRREDPISLSSGRVSLAFDELPDTIRIQCWPQSEWGNTDAAPSLLSENQTDITLKPGGWVYEVYAEWAKADNRNFYGNGFYVFFAIVA